MIYCKKTIVAACFTLMLPCVGWSAAPVVDDSEQFAMIDEQQAYGAPVVPPRDEEPLVENQNNSQWEEPALVKEDLNSNSNINNNASLIDKIQGLQKELQELRGQLEVQAHDLKLLKEQQLSFYKDLDSRIANANPKKITNTMAVEAPIPSKAPIKTSEAPASITSVSRINPADEQISYLAAYELVKNKKYDDALASMHSFVQKYPKGGYTANAQYWLGELYLVKKDFPKAIEHFEVVLKQFPSSAKAAASMLKEGYAYAATGDNQNAARYLREVVRNYPGTPTAQLAHSKLETIKDL